MERDDRIVWDVFQGKSTYLNDYRCTKKKTDRSSNVFPYVRKKLREKETAAYVPIDTETFIPWKKGSHIPFDLYHYPKGIIDTHPKDVIKLPEPLIDKDRDLVIKTRPRIYMKSAVSLDDIPDKGMRKFICEALYTTEARMSEKEATVSFKSKPPPSDLIIGENPTFNIDVEVFPQLENGWIRKVNDWDTMQVRKLTDSNKMFWNNTELPTRDGSPLTDLVSESKKIEIRKLIDEEMLRLPHDYPKPLYTGYMPMLSYGIPLRKKVKAVTHPFISTSQAITTRYEED